MAYEYIRRVYGVEPVPGQRVRLEGPRRRVGTVAPERTPSHYVHVVFDGESQPSPCHPRSLEYLGPSA